jgi:L-ribulose-5-phosphate 4-epimerase
MDDINIPELKGNLTQICKEIFKQNLVKLGEGNVSIRIPNRNEMIITPAGNNYLNLQSDKMVHLGLDGTSYDKSLEPSSEFRMHLALYQQRPEAQCIIHTHSPYASTLAVLHKSIPVIIDEMSLFLGGGVSCTEYYPAGTDSLANEILKVMSKQNAVIIANHGVVIVGKTSEYCIKAAVIIEKMAQIYLNALKIGKVQTIPIKYQIAFIKIFQEKYATF